MSHMLVVPTSKLSHPVSLIIDVVSRDWLHHRRLTEVNIRNCNAARVKLSDFEVTSLGYCSRTAFLVGWGSNGSQA